MSMPPSCRFARYFERHSFTGASFAAASRVPARATSKDIRHPGTSLAVTRPSAALLRKTFLHERLALVAFHLLLARFLVAGFHLVLLSALLVGLVVFLVHVLALQARAHEFLAVVAFTVAGLGRAVLHALLLG